MPRATARSTSYWDAQATDGSTAYRTFHELPHVSYGEEQAWQEEEGGEGRLIGE